LGGLIYEDVVEVLIVESAICGGNAGGADDVRSLDDVVFCLLPQLFELLLLVGGQFFLRVHHLVELFQFLVVGFAHVA
jgi:hypothetical protein